MQYLSSLYAFLLHPDGTCHMFFALNILFVKSNYKLVRPNLFWLDLIFSTPSTWICRRIANFNCNFSWW